MIRRYLITRQIVAEIDVDELAAAEQADRTTEEGQEAIRQRIIESLVDDVNDSVGAEHSTSDEKLDYTPVEIVGVAVEDLGEIEQEVEPEEDFE